MEHILMQFLQNNRIDSMVFIIVQIAVQFIQLLICQNMIHSEFHCNLSLTPILIF